MKYVFTAFFLLFSSSIIADETSILNTIKDSSILLMDGDTKLASKREHRKLIPASTTKIVTSWMALNRWGPDYRFKTEFYFEKNVLYIKGYGDPFLVSEEIQIIANSLKQLKIKKVDKIVLDTTLFSDDSILHGNYGSTNPYDAIPSALSANFNTVNLKKSKGVVYSSESQTPLTNISRSMYKGITSKKLRVNLGHDISINNQYFGELLSAILNKNGVYSTDIIEFGYFPDEKPTYTHYNSMTLEEMIEPMMKYSNNFIANQLILIMSSEHYRRPANKDDASQYMNMVLHAYFKFDDIEFFDGAGLSRKNSISSNQLVQLLKDFKDYAYLFPKFKEEGIYAKTGTLKGVRTLAGYVENSDGELLPFAILINDNNKNIKQIRYKLAIQLKELVN